jgi:CDP-paratose 2-epimerase
MQSAALQRGRALITGGCGFIGSNLADALLRRGQDVAILDSLARSGSERNLIRLQKRYPGRFDFIKADIRDYDALVKAMAGVDVVFHLAAQVAVTSSLNDPIQDFSINISGTLNVLEAARTANRRPGLIFASTNKVYGDLADLKFSPASNGYRPANKDLAEVGINEDRPLQFRTPYGCSKGAADQYVLDYGHSFGLNTVVFRMSCVYGPWQMGNEDQGWVAHFAHRLSAGEPVTIYGDGLQVRDLLYVDDAVRAYLAAWDQLHRFNGAVFNLGGGPANAVSVETVLHAISEKIGRVPHIERAAWRKGDQLWYVTCPTKAMLALGLRPSLHWRSGLDQLLRWIAQDVSHREAVDALP